MCKQFIGVAVLLLLPVLAMADDDCPNAVDAADTLNQNDFKNCDYTKTGLSGVLHRALANSSTGDEPEKIAKKAAPEPEAKPVTKINRAGQFSSAEQLQQIRFELVQQAMQECQKGFVIDSESYLPVEAKRLKLELRYHCL